MNKKYKKHRNHGQKSETGIRAQPRVVVSGICVAIPEELRLKSGHTPDLPKVIIDQNNHIQGELARLREGKRYNQTVEVIPPKVTSTLALIATNAWRAKVRIIDPETGQPKEDLRRIYRHIEGIFNAFDELGMKIIDPTGRAYDSGMALKAISFEQTHGLAREEIKETIKPSVTWNDRLIQMGEVIVGTPEQKTFDKETANEQNNH